MILPIIAGAIAMFAFGALWYTVIFGRMWSKLMGLSSEQMSKAKEGGMAGKMVVMFAFNLLTAGVVYYLGYEFLALNFTEFLHKIIIVWAGFVLPLQFGPMLWEGKSFKLILLNVVHGILSFSILSAVIYRLS